MASPQTAEALAPTRIVDLAAQTLAGDASTLNHPYEAVALIGHACMLAVDFRLIGLGEDHRIG
jgi:hypothetical protein